MTNWKLLVKAQELAISDQEVDQIQASMDALEAAFRPLIGRISSYVEPALIFRCLPEEKE